MSYPYKVFVHENGEHVLSGETSSPDSAVRLGKALGKPFHAIGPKPESEQKSASPPVNDAASVRFSLLELD